MSFTIHDNYLRGLRNAKPTTFGEQVIHPPKGSMSASRVVPPLIIPPLNTNIRYSMLPEFKLSEHKGLAALDITKIPKEFNWRKPHPSDTSDIKKKKSLITTPGNQMLCGSCWSIAGAGITSDNFVVSGVVNWKPNLSTTWSLSCYPQHKCQGGNPAVLFNDIAKGGIASNHCVDYSWCAENENCNGSAIKHMEKQKINLSTLIPNCGCYSGNDHYLYKIDPNPKNIFIGSEGITEDNVANIIKKHIYTKGPVLGSFLVFKNFMKGTFTHMNGGVYLEDGVYNENSEITFDPSQATQKNYAGSHAIAIIGWGVAKGIKTSKGMKDVPYWYCRNSWTEKWGDGGYFKFAMYPWNKNSVMEKLVQVGNKKGGGVVMISASQKPELKSIKKNNYDKKKSKPVTFYNSEQKDYGKSSVTSINWKNILKWIGIGLGVLIAIVGAYYLVVKVKKIFLTSSTPLKGVRSVKVSKPKSTSIINRGSQVIGRPGFYGFKKY